MSDEDEDLTDLMPLRDIAELIPAELDVSFRQLQRWAEKDKDRGFPDPEETLGIYKLYSNKKVQRWIVLWRKATKGLGRGDAMNQARRERSGT